MATMKQKRFDKRITIILGKLQDVVDDVGALLDDLQMEAFPPDEEEIK